MSERGRERERQREREREREREKRERETTSHTPVTENSSSKNERELARGRRRVDPLQCLFVPAVTVGCIANQTIGKSSPQLETKLSFVHGQFHVF